MTYFFGICPKEITVQRFFIITLWLSNNSHGLFLPHYGWSWDIFPWQPYNYVSYEMSHEANHIYFSCLVPVRIVFCMATCCCNDRFNETYFCYDVTILVIDPIDSALLGMINVKKLHGKLIITYLWSHQIQDALGYNAYSYMTYSLFLYARKAFTMMVVQVASDTFVGTVVQAVTFWHMQKWKWKLLDESIFSLTNNSLASAPTASISTYSCLLLSIQLQWGSSLVRVLTRHNYCGNHGHCDCHVALAFGCIKWPNNIDPCIGGHVWHLLLHDKATQISGSARLVPEVLRTFRHELWVEREVTAAFLPHQG
jgi:hypothetical protein